MKNLVLLLVIAMGFTSCKTDDDMNVISPEVSRKEYVFALVSSQQECTQSLSFGVNCAQSITFTDDTNASVIVTDIVNGGTYLVSGKTVTISYVSSSDSEDPMVFEANAYFTELTRTSDGSNDVWKLQRAGVDPWDL